MHYRGLLRIAGRDSGVRLYAARQPHAPAADADAALDALVNVVVAKYAPLPERSLGELISHLRGGAPQWAAGRRAAFVRAKQRLPSVRIDGSNWYWPAGENPLSKRHACDSRVRLLAPFDPLVWDRRRFEQFWGWAYRFEAYTPSAKRVRGYYAMPMLWREQVIGWGNLAVVNGVLQAHIGYQAGRAPRDAGFRNALRDELGAIGEFLGLSG